jgi:hypothetical protein
MIGKNIPLNTTYRPQLLVGLVLGIWLYFFLALVGPFDAAELSLKIRIGLMLGYGLVFFVSYALLIPIQNKLYTYLGKWTLGYEVAVVTFFCLYCLPASYVYYKTEAVNGTFSFTNFTLTVYLPTIIILLPVIFAGRFLIGRYDKEGDSDVALPATVVLSGSNKLDILKLTMSDLVALEAANNYVTVYYLQAGQLQRKLLRNSLRKMHEAVPTMVQVHRSYLVNSEHFLEWKDGQNLVLTQLTVPVSQKYKAGLLTMPVFTPK